MDFPRGERFDRPVFLFNRLRDSYCLILSLFWPLPDTNWMTDLTVQLLPFRYASPRVLCSMTTSQRPMPFHLLLEILGFSILLLSKEKLVVVNSRRLPK